MKLRKTQNDVIKHVKADAAWEISRGEDAHIAVIDTGVCGDLKEFPKWKRAPFGWPNFKQAWIDPCGHGSMTASIAAGTTSSGGRYNGIAPCAKIISCRTEFSEDELCRIYEYLINLVIKQRVGRLVINNSYSVQSPVAPDVKPDDPLPRLVKDAAANGIATVFPAGNNNKFRRRKSIGQHPFGTIWGINSLDEVLCVATVDEENRLDRPARCGFGYSHQDSGRGPGQLAVRSVKPDCAAPTYGEVLWGRRYVVNEWWGTSGAAAEAAGLAALMLSINPLLTSAQVQEIIRQTCIPLQLPETSAGAGLIDCYAAVMKASKHYGIMAVEIGSLPDQTARTLLS